jgi:hypothetical protein
MVIKSDMGKGKHDKGGGKHGMMAPMGSQHWEKDVGDIECCNLKYAGKDSMDNPERLKDSVNKLSSYTKKHSMTHTYD